MTKLSEFDKTMAAAAFAEADDHRNAQEFIDQKAAPQSAPAKKGAGLKALVWGLVSICLYALAFTHQDLLSNLYTRGKWYAALPIITVFLFSFIHGSFANYSLSSLGLEAKRK